MLIQIIASVLMTSAAIGKWRELSFAVRETRRFRRDFAESSAILEYYFKRRPTETTGVVGIYRETCERLLKQFPPEVRLLLAGHSTEIKNVAPLTAKEMELVRGTCEHALDEEEIRVESGTGVVTTVVALSPMLGLLGTVWGVLDAFAEMGTAASANLATIAPSISAALVTTVVGLLVAIPGVMVSNFLTAKIRSISSDMEGLVDELLGRIALEFQDRGA